MTVDLWSMPIPVMAPASLALQATLSPSELERAARFIAADKRSEFITCRGALRILLARYLDQSPESVALSTLPGGKPTLADPQGLFFNLSHTTGLMLVAIARGMPVGVDVEKVRHVEGASQITSRYFSAQERADMTNDPSSFLSLWTRRESALKALGLGISAGWDSLQIIPRSTDTADALGPQKNCHIRLLTPRAGYVAAVSAVASHFDLCLKPALEFTALELAGFTDDHLTAH